jgi:hypothetical protein
MRDTACHGGEHFYEVSLKFLNTCRRYALHLWKYMYHQFVTVKYMVSYIFIKDNNKYNALHNFHTSLWIPNLVLLVINIASLDYKDYNQCNFETIL